MNRRVFFTVSHNLRYVSGRKDICDCGNFKTDKERLAHTEHHFVEQQIEGCRFGMAANVAGHGKITVALSSPMVAFGEFKILFPFNPDEIFLKSQVDIVWIGVL